MLGEVGLAGGGAGKAICLEGEIMVLVLDRALAPGAPMEMTLVHPSGTTLALRAKAIGSKRRSDGRFDVRARMVSLRRDERALLTRG